jgi:hypothetical protein
MSSAESSAPDLSSHEELGEFSEERLDILCYTVEINHADQIEKGIPTALHGDALVQSPPS